MKVFVYGSFNAGSSVSREIEASNVGATGATKSEWLRLRLRLRLRAKCVAPAPARLHVPDFGVGFAPKLTVCLSSRNQEEGRLHDIQS